MNIKRHTDEIINECITERAETEIHGEQVSIVLRKVFACPESFCAGFFSHLFSKVSRAYGKFLDCLENF